VSLQIEGLDTAAAQVTHDRAPGVILQTLAAQPDERGPTDLQPSLRHRRIPADNRHAVISTIPAGIMTGE
jgi:hypothetical protein